MWEQMKRAMVERAREVCESVRLRGKNPKSAWWNDEVKAAVRRKNTAWKKVLTKGKNKDLWRRTEKKRKRLKGVLYIYILLEIME